MKCYFCHNEVEQDPDTSGGSFRTIRSKSCDYCTLTHGIHHVSFIYNKDGSYMYAHIFLDEVKYATLGAPSFMKSGVTVALNETFHIRLNMAEETTSIVEYGTANEIIRLPTLKINPSNVREKVKLYLLFS